MAVAGDVPNKYDLVIGTEGYVLADNWTGGDTSNAPQKAIHAFSPAFVQRTNTEGNYGDDQQDFWLTFSQKDWSEGERQRHALDEKQGSTRYWQGEAVDVTTPGRVSMRRAVESVDFGASAVYNATHVTDTGIGIIAVVGETNLYTVTANGTVTDRGAHGASVSSSPIKVSVVGDGTDLYISGSVANVRKWDSLGPTYSNFSGTGARSLAVLNNSLFGFGASVQTLYRYNTAGVATALFTWAGVDGGSFPDYEARIAAFGGKLLILRSLADSSSQLWIFDGVGVSQVASFPYGFLATSLTVDSGGTVYIGGSFLEANNTTPSNKFLKPAIFYYANGQVGKLWDSDEWTTSAASGVMEAQHPEVKAFRDGLIFTDGVRGRLMLYSPALGGIHTIGEYDETAGTIPRIAAATDFFLFVQNDDVAYLYPDTSTRATTASITSSLIDFDSSLNKIFRGIKVTYDEASDGDGGSVDIAYRIADVDGSYTTLQTGITSGTEYTLDNITGRSISYKITLNKGTSTKGPVLKRVYVRAVPLGNNYHRARYVLQSWGKNGESPIELRDGSLEARSGQDVAMDLMDAAESQTPLTITDKFETFTGIVENCELIEFRDREYVAQVTVRQI